LVKRCLECGHDNTDRAEVCVGCGSTLIEVADDKASAGPMVVNVPPGSGAVTPYVDILKIRGPPRAKLSFGLCFIATLLVVLNGILVGPFSPPFPIPVQINPYSYIGIPWDVMGVFVGFWMLIGCILILARKEIYGSAFIIFLSVVSLIGGGVFVGFFIAIIGALIALFKK